MKIKRLLKYLSCAICKIGIMLQLVYPVKAPAQDLIHLSELKKYPDFESRRNMMIDSMAKWAGHFTLDDFKGSDDFEGGKYGAYPVMALFESGQIKQARAFASQQLVGGAAMFREYSTMALYMEYHHLYDEELKQKVKNNQINSNFFDPTAEVIDTSISESHRNPRLGGASENHKLMYAAAAYLAGLAWPDEYPKAWAQIGYNHLMHWFEIVTSIGFWEEDSPTYLIHHLGPILSVADHAPEGSEIKRKATMVLDWYFASIAGEYLRGYWITPTARDYNPLYGLSISAETTALTWLLFGDAPQIPFPHVYQPFRHWKATIHFAVSDYRVPDIIKRIATDRDQPFVHKEFMAKNPMLPKEYCYLNKTYGMASILDERGKIPPDMTRWKVQWVANESRSEPSAFFMKHPFKKDSNDSNWQQWRGASKSEQVLQHENALVAVYKIDSNQMPFIDGPFKEKVFQAVKRKDGWIFMHAGTCMLAVKAVNGLEITNEKRFLSHFHGPENQMQVLKSDGTRNGLIVQTASPANYHAENASGSLGLFMKDILENTEIDATQINTENPNLVYKSLSGDLLEIAFNQFKKVNREVLAFDEWPLLGNPWMHQNYKGNQLVLEHKGMKRVYDFSRWEISEQRTNHSVK